MKDDADKETYNRVKLKFVEKDLYEGDTMLW